MYDVLKLQFCILYIEKERERERERERENAYETCAAFKLWLMSLICVRLIWTLGALGLSRKKNVKN